MFWALANLGRAWPRGFEASCPTGEIGISRANLAGEIINYQSRSGSMFQAKHCYSFPLTYQMMDVTQEMQRGAKFGIGLVFCAR